LTRVGYQGLSKPVPFDGLIVMQEFMCKGTQVGVLVKFNGVIDRVVLPKDSPSCCVYRSLARLPNNLSRIRWIVEEAALQVTNLLQSSVALGARG